MENYLLKNKDTLLMAFRIRKTPEIINKNLFHTYSLKITYVNHEEKHIFPFEFRHYADDAKLLDWIENRTSILGRKLFSILAKNIKFDPADPMRFAKLSNLLSLNDTYWISEENDFRKWKDVNLYDNYFTETIGKILFNSYIDDMEYTYLSSPEITSKGVLRKAWTRTPEGIFLRKADDYFSTEDGLSQVTAEWFASQVCQVFGITHIPYDLSVCRHRDGRQENVCLCRLFTSKNVGFVDAKTVFLHKNVPAENLTPSNLKSLAGQMYLAKIFGEQFYEDMMIFDALILNQDRHLGNFGYLFDTDSGELLEPAPLFDNGLSFIVGLGGIRERELEDIASRHNAAFLPFDDQAKLFLRERHIPKLKKCLTLSLKEHSRVSVRPETVGLLNTLIHIRAGQLLRLAERHEKASEEELPSLFDGPGM